MNVPESELPGLVPTQADRAHLAFAALHGVDWIGVSFVQAADDLERVRACLTGVAAPLLMAKIEKRRALVNLDAIIERADGVMVARGDLGVETDLAEIPLAQKRIIAAANARGRPVVTATQMLESMVEHERPTRAEVTDVANAVLDGTDAVMLSAESAVGRNPEAAVTILQRVLAATEGQYATHMASSRLSAAHGVSEGDAVAFAACQLAQRVNARAIVSRVSDHRLPVAIARFRPSVPIIASTSSQALFTRLTMVCGVSPLHDESGDAHSHVNTAREWLFDRAFARSGDRVVLVSAPTDAPATPDALQLKALIA